MFVTDSGTMASESAMLGIPVIYTNNLPLMCYLKKEQKKDLLFQNITEKEIESTIEKIC